MSSNGDNNNNNNNYRNIRSSQISQLSNKPNLPIKLQQDKYLYLIQNCLYLINHYSIEIGLDLIYNQIIIPCDLSNTTGRNAQVHSFDL